MIKQSGGLVSKLIEKILVTEASIEDLLRNCLYIGTQLNSLPKDWSIKSELEGYDDIKKIPSYRIIPSRIKAFHPVWGFQKIENLESMILNSNNNGSWKYYYPNYYLQCPVGEIEEILSHYKNKMEIALSIPVPLSDYIIKNLTGLGSRPESIDITICKTALKSTIGSLKNSILNWAMELQKLGIDSEGVNFTENDKILAEGIGSLQLSHNNNVNVFYTNNSPNCSQSGTNSIQHEISKETIEEIIKSIESPEIINAIPSSEKKYIEKELTSLKTEKDSSIIQTTLNKLAKGFLAINSSGAFTAIITLITKTISG